jgi:anti-repressor protein
MRPSIPSECALNEIQPFTFPDTAQQVRVVLIDDEPWFVAADVAEVLNLGNLHSSLALLDDDERTLHTVEDGRRSMVAVSEPGLYSLILRSRKPEAKAFKRWITHDVLPAIRRTGAYGITQIGRRELAHMVIAAEDARLAAEARVAELESDAARARRTMDAFGMALVGTVAKRFGIKERALREFLYTEQLLIRGGSRHNEPHARYVQSGHFTLKTRLLDVHPRPGSGGAVDHLRHPGRRSADLEAPLPGRPRRLTGHARGATAAHLISPAASAAQQVYEETPTPRPFRSNPGGAGRFLLSAVMVNGCSNGRHLRRTASGATAGWPRAAWSRPRRTPVRAATASAQAAPRSARTRSSATPATRTTRTLRSSPRPNPTGCGSSTGWSVRGGSERRWA